jgi:uncharacterized protein YdiU (UPF0061 family)
VELTETPPLTLEHRFADALPELCVPWEGATVADPELIVLNDALAADLGLDAATLRTTEGVGWLVGAAAPEGALPVAQAYAGHQFGGYSPRLGDGRALLLGELVAPDGSLRDLHLKGSGRTPFARGGDGKAALGPMLREYVVSEAMAALGIPTTRSLAVTTTGEAVRRDPGPLPGAVLARTAASHLRVGTFQYAAALGDREVLARLADHAIERHHPAVADAPNRHLALYEAVLASQAELVAQWMRVGFIHGVMNTDNTTISGETIDYGPCAFLDVHDPAAVYSSIDHGGRYAYGNQPAILQWNLARLAEAMLPLFDEDQDQAVAVATRSLQSFGDRFLTAWHRAMRAKVGLVDEREEDGALIDDLLRTLHEQHADHTASFRALSSAVRGDDAPLRAWLTDPAAIDPWLDAWRSRLASERRDPEAVADAMDRVNPVVIPRNHLVEEALDAATAGDLTPFRTLVDQVQRPFDERPDGDRFALPAPPGFTDRYQTFCGT